jgi:hypothetical protein
VSSHFARAAREPLPLDERPIGGVTPKIILSIVLAAAAGAGAWVHLEVKESDTADKVVELQANTMRDHDLLTKMDGKLDAVLKADRTASR